MKHVLVTGADGFIGSHLVELLLSEGYSVRALSQYNSFNYWGWLDDMHHDNLEVVCGDVRDPNYCREIVRGCDTVLHLAALIAIPYSYVAPDSYVDTNIKGTLNICQACRDLGVERLVVTSTSEVYGTALYVPIDEKHPRQPQSPYSATKIGADAIAKSFYNAFNLPVVIARPFNTYGPRQSVSVVILVLSPHRRNTSDFDGRMRCGSRTHSTSASIIRAISFSVSIIDISLLVQMFISSPSTPDALANARKPRQVSFT